MMGGGGGGGGGGGIEQNMNDASSVAVKINFTWDL